MRAMKRLLPSLALIVFTLTPAAAQADGLPLPVDESNNGVLTDDGLTRFFTASARGRTAVIAQDARDGSVIAAEMLKGRFTVPLVSYDGTAGGLSGDERTVVLIRPRPAFPRKRTSFAVFRSDRKRLRIRLRRFVHLRGDFSFDALSRDGKSLFLINYISPRNPRRYRVRVYDLERGRLAPKPIVDPREDPDEMNGFPVARAVSPNDRWAYTLYEGKHHPFVHALDMGRRRAVCIDLDDIHVNPYELRLESESSRELAVMRGSEKVAVVDTRTFEVREPADHAEAGAAQSERKDGVVWPLPAAGIVLLGGGLLAARARARAR